ncbi:MAG: SIMPL domain-containing protein [Candidatus Peribacteraceae bacterium]|nr:SIMPL domain-containing protein [Candidatus Peribacteraceae bacterium]MDD5741883.1 SIMPL domain-containing protein [Candidatus Peribacteraceae bacterium]
MEDTNVAVRPPVWLAILLVLVAGGFYLTGKVIEQKDFAPMTISVESTGKASAVPDIAVVSFGVQTGRQSTAPQAMKILAQKMSDIVAAVKKQGIEDKDITTDTLSLQPEFDWKEGQQIPRGYQATESLHVKVRDLDKIGDLLAAVTGEGVNQVGGVDFTMDDPEALQAAAREKAIVKAEAKARLLATQLGRSISRLKGFSEGGYAAPMDYRKANVMMDSVGGGAPLPSVPVAAGEQEVNVSVSLIYELR